MEVSNQLQAPAALPWRKSPRYPLDRRFGGLGAGLDDVERRKLLILPGLEIRPLGRLARNQSLYRVRYPGPSILLPYCGCDVVASQFVMVWVSLHRTFVRATSLFLLYRSVRWDMCVKLFSLRHVVKLTSCSLFGNWDFVKAILRLVLDCRLVTGRLENE
jgi:hypothetical protein